MVYRAIRNLFRLADMDLAVAINSETTMHPKPLEIICFHCQQAVEKYLKAYLRSQTGEAPPRTHNLVELCTLCQEREPQFGDIKSACAKLTMYAVQTRYDDGIEVDETDMRRALRYAAEIKAFPPLAELREILEQENDAV